MNGTTIIIVLYHFVQLLFYHMLHYIATNYRDFTNLLVRSPGMINHLP